MAEANIVADRPHNREMHHLNRKGIPWMDLTDLSLTDIVETVSHAKKIDQLPPDCRPPSTLSSTMSRPPMPRRIPISSNSTSTLSRLARLAASRIPISALKCPQSSTNGLSTSTQGGRDTQDAFQSMQESSMTPREEIAAKYMGVGASFEYTETKVMEKEVPLSEWGGMPKKVSFARSISVRVYSPSTQRSSMIRPTPPCSTLPRIVPLSQMEYTRSASVSPSISKPPTSSPSESPSQKRSQITAGSGQSVDNKGGTTAENPTTKDYTILTATNPIISSSSGSPSGSPITASPYASPITSKPTTSIPSESPSGSGRQINASPPASPRSSKPTVASRFPKRFPLSQGKYTGCPSALSPSLTGQSASAPGRRSSGQPVDNKSGANPPDYKSPSTLSSITSRPPMPRRIPISALKCLPSSTESQYRKGKRQELDKGIVDNSLPLLLQVENKSIEGSRREDNDDIILSRSSKFKSIEGVLVKSNVYLAGNFNVNLSNVTK